MGKVHRSYRLEEDTVEGVQAWATEHEMTVTAAMDYLLLRGIEAEDMEDMRHKLDKLSAQAEAWAEQKSLLGANLRDLRAQVSMLTAQLTEKDSQIERLSNITDHAQVISAVHVGNSITNVSQADTQARGIWAWLARKIQGG